MVRLVEFLACFFWGYVGVLKERRELNWRLEVVYRSSFDSGEQCGFENAILEKKVR
jgi:hypothetical protein